MTYTKTVWTDNVTPVDAAKMNNIESGIASVDLGKPSYGTSLPASPVDGQEAILVDVLGGANYSWRFRYNASSSSPRKWEFIGGTPWMVADSANPGTQGAGWHELSTPALTIPRSGYYMVETNIDQGGTQAPGLMAQGPNFSGQPSPSYYSQFYADSANVCGWAPIKCPLLCSAGAVLKIFGYGANGTWTVNNRWICVTPLAVS